MFDMNKFLIDHLWSIIGLIFLGYGAILRMWFTIQEVRRDIINNKELKIKELSECKEMVNSLKSNEIESVKKFNDERYEKLEKKMDRMFEVIDGLKSSIDHMTGYMMGLKDKQSE